MKPKNFFVILLSILVFSSIGFSIAAHADDDDDDRIENVSQESDDEDDEDDDEDIAAPEPEVENAASDDSKSQDNETSKTTTKTVVTPATTIIVNEVREVTLADSDRDGLFDNADPHPNVAEIYFVKDDNFNGIVDSFEQ